jgi:DNA-binding transcriptional ArsR family regulator
MIVVCPACFTSQNYEARNNDEKRKRKLCISCHKKFDIKTSRTADAIKKTQSIKSEIKSESRTKNNLENAIISIFSRCSDYEKSQSDIAKTLNISVSTVSRKLKKLEDLELILSINEGGVKKYKLKEVLKDIDEPEQKLNAVKTHKIRVKCSILSGTINPKEFSKESKMKNWSKKYFEENNLLFQLTPKSITFYPSGIGLSADDSLNKAKETSIDVKRFIETKYQCSLSFPEFYLETDKPHHVPIQTTLKNLKLNEKVWTDESHPGAIETESKDFVNSIIKINDDVQELKKQNNNTDFNNAIITIQNSIAEINAKIEMIVNCNLSMTNMFKNALEPKNNIQNEKPTTASYI